MSLEEGWRIYGARAVSDTREEYFATRHSLLPQFFSDQPCYSMNIYINVEIVYDYHL